MTIHTFARKIALKYKFAIDSMSLTDDEKKMLSEKQVKLDEKIRTNLTMPTKILSNPRREILLQLAGATFSNPKGARDIMAMNGLKAIKQIISKIKNLDELSEKAPISVLLGVTSELYNYMLEQKDLKFSLKGEPIIPGKDQNTQLLGLPDAQFPHMMEAINSAVAARTKTEERFRDTKRREAREGLVDIMNRLGTAIQDAKDYVERDKLIHGESAGLFDVKDIKSPEHVRKYIHQRGALPEQDIVDFIRQHGPHYFIWSRSNWQNILDKRPDLYDKVVTVINATNRGKTADVDGEVKAILRDLYNERVDNFIHLYGNEFNIHSKKEWNDYVASDFGLLAEIMDMMDFLEKDVIPPKASFIKDEINKKRNI